MLETALIAVGVALLTSVAADFLLSWGTRLRLRRVERQLAEYEERLTREQKVRAAAASVAARGKLNPMDEALVRKFTGDQDGAEFHDETPWWDGLVKK
jgi:hypothetical protein